jgi:ABC-type Mn2+/Zn2+ transport system ATPase subunit
MTGDELIRMDCVSCHYGSQPVLVGVDLEIRAGQLTGVVGPSGSGKTSLLRAILGTLKPSEGAIERRGGLRMAYVPQVETVNWSFPVTVEQCVLMARVGGRLLPWASRAEKHEVAAVLARLGLEELGGRHIRELSGGQQQRVFIARALLGRPELLLLDEPTSGVDVRLRHEVLHLLGELNATGVAILLTTHDLNGIAAHLPHLVCLNREVIGAGPAKEVLTQEILERTYGASMEVLQHGGMTVIVDTPGSHDAHGLDPTHATPVRTEVVS